MSALRRVASAPWLVLALWAGQIAVALVFGSVLASLVAAAMSPFAALDDGYVFGAVVELLSLHPSVGAAVLAGLATGALVGVLGWTLAAGFVIGRLGGVRRDELGPRWISTLPGVFVTSLWHLAIRGALLFAVALAVAPLPRLVGMLVFAIVLAVSTLALDLARVQIVLHGAPSFHVRTAANAYAQALRQWPLLARILGPWMLQMMTVGASVWLALASLGGESHLWAVRALSLCAVVLGLWRVALVVEAGPVPLGPSARR